MPDALPTTRDFTALEASQRARWVLLLGALTAIGALTVDMYLPAFPQLRTDLSTTATLVQLTLTGTLVGAALGQVVVGPLSDALGRRGPLLIGLAVHLLASVGCALAPTIEVLSALRLLQGLGSAAAAVTALAVVRDLFDGAGASRLVARLTLVLGASPIFAPSLGGWLLSVTDWRGIFWVLALISLLLLLVVAARLPETLPRARRRPAGVGGTARTYAALLRDRVTWGVVLTAGLTHSMIFSYVGGAPFVLQELYGLTAGQFALAFAVIGTCFVAGTQVTAQLVARVEAEHLLLVGIGGAVLSALALVVDVSSHRAGVLEVTSLLCLITVFIGVALPTTAAIVLNRNGWAAGSAAALVGFASFGVGAVVFPLVSLVGLRSDLTTGLSVIVGGVAAFVVMAVVVLPVVRAERRLLPV